MRITILEQQMSFLKAELKEIKNNHLFHIQKSINDLDLRINKLEKKIAYWAGGITMAIVLIDILLKLIK